MKPVALALIEDIIREMEEKKAQDSIIKGIITTPATILLQTRFGMSN